MVMECHCEAHARLEPEVSLIYHQRNLQLKSDSRHHAVPLFHTEHADCSFKLSGCFCSTPSRRKNSEAAYRVEKDNSKLLPTINSHAQVVLRGRMGYMSKVKVMWRELRGEATGEATLAVVVSKLHTGGSTVMVGRSHRNGVSVGDRQHFG